MALKRKPVLPGTTPTIQTARVPGSSSLCGQYQDPKYKDDTMIKSANKGLEDILIRVGNPPIFWTRFGFRFLKEPVKKMADSGFLSF